MIKDATKEKHAAIQAEYNRLVRLEYQENPRRAKYIAKDFYVETIASNPQFDVKDMSHIRKIINGAYGRKRGK